MTEDIRRTLLAVADVLDSSERLGSPIAPGVEGGVWIKISDELALEMSRDLKDAARELEVRNK